MTRESFGILCRALRADLVDLAPGSLVLVAVSGGADSLACAAAAAVEAPRLGLRVGAVTVDHGLQVGSAERAVGVATTCSDLGLDPVVVETVDVRAAGDGPEAAARTARYAAIDRAARTFGAVAVLVAHTLDDQAETVLLGLARGSGARSLAGMSARRGLIRRPLLGVRRDDTAKACAELGLPPWRDPHNDDPSFVRVRVRHDALPALEASLGPGIAEALARSAELLRADADALDDLAATARSEDTDLGTGQLICSDVSERPTAIRTRILKAASFDAGVPTGALTALHLRALDRLITAAGRHGPVRLPGGLEASVACDRLSFR